MNPGNVRRLRRCSALAIGLLLMGPAEVRADPFDDCIQRIRASRQARAITAATWQLVGPLRPDERVLASLNTQPEFSLPVWDYVAVMVDQERIDDGLGRMAAHRATFDAISRKYGVDAAVLAAVWGVESNYGRNRGGLHVLRSLATLSCMGRRQTYFRGEFLAALRIVQAGHAAPQQFVGSWAGAFGQTQFMPSTFERLAVDFDGDGKRDLMDSEGDALASAANYLRNAGWQSGAPWGFEVRLPAREGRPFPVEGEGRRVPRTLATWTSRGLTRVDGTPLVRDGLEASVTAGLLTPAGARGPAFLVLRNFTSVYRYNASESYALSIVHLADRLRGGTPFVTTWPTDDPGLSRSDRRELQTLLARRGHEIGDANGVLTPRTREAVKAEQRRLGHEETGRPGQKLLEALRESSVPFANPSTWMPPPEQAERKQRP